MNVPYVKVNNQKEFEHITDMLGTFESINRADHVQTDL